MTAGYAAFQTNLNISAKGNIIEKSRIIRSWDRTSNEDFHTDFYKENIITVTFLDTNNVPDNVIESWDVSAKKDKGVMAYVVNSASEPKKYDLFIGANKGVIANEDSSYMFYAFSGMKSIEFNDNFDTSNIINMRRMFAGGNNVITLDLSSFDTSNVIDMGSIFSAWNEEKGDFGNRTMTEINFGKNFNTSKVTDMSGMFSGQPVKNIDLSSFDTGNVTNMYHMFYRCLELKELNLCSFNTEKVIDMREIFFNTKLITKIKVGSGWLISNADTFQMFYASNISSVTTGEC